MYPQRSATALRSFLSRSSRKVPTAPRRRYPVTITGARVLGIGYASVRDLVSFFRLIVGQAQGPQLFFNGKLKVGGDLMFSQQVSGFFRQP